MRTLPKSGCAKTAPSRGSLRDRKRRHLPHSLPGGGLPEQNPGGEPRKVPQKQSRQLCGETTSLTTHGPIPKIRPLLFLRASRAPEPGICPKRDEVFPSRYMPLHAMSCPKDTMSSEPENSCHRSGRDMPPQTLHQTKTLLGSTDY